MAQFLNENKDQIIAQLNANQGGSVDLGGYYKLNDEKTTSAVFPIEFEIDLSTNIKNTLVNSTII